MDCGSSDPMVQEPLLSFSAVFFPPMSNGEIPVTQPVKFFTFKETDLKKKDFDLQKFHLADVHIQREESGEMDPNMYLPGAAVVYCPVSRSFLIVGGDLCSSPFPDAEWAPVHSLWSFCADAPPQPRPGTYTWKLRARMSQGRAWGFAVPCDGLVYIIGGERCPKPLLEIYDPRSGSLQPPIPLDGDLFDHMSSLPRTYFLWRDPPPPHKKPLIMLMFDHCDAGSQLLSFDVESKLIAMFDSNFLPLGRGTRRSRLVPLEGTNTLLIMQAPSFWVVYDLIDRKDVGVVEFVGFQDWGLDVMHGLCRQCLDGSHVVYIFLDAIDTFDFEDICYAKFRLQKEEDGRFVATLESGGALGNGECSDFIIFADQVTVPEEAADPPLSGDEGRPGKRRR